MRRIIGILTDYGVSDNYNAVLEAVIKKINPEVDIIYISPEVKPFNIYAGAYLLYTSYKYFKKNTIFLAIVDPGVGSKRRAIVIRTNNYYFVGPDNGILYPSAYEDGIIEVRTISNPKIFLSREISNTFHGRDIFCVAAALLSRKVDMQIFGEKIDPSELVQLEYNYSFNNKRLCAKVIYIDHFGNIALSVKGKDIRFSLAKYNERIMRRVRTFSDGGENELIIYENGYGFLEIGVNMGNAQKILGIKEGEEICLEVFTQEDFSHSI
ncbi:MAG: S-adenosyl-l-methionine hydroxide adenosyltransferase family protein [Sulfolobaceae archaeon]